MILGSHTLHYVIFDLILISDLLVDSQLDIPSVMAHLFSDIDSSYSILSLNLNRKSSNSRIVNLMTQHRTAEARRGSWAESAKYKSEEFPVDFGSLFYPICQPSTHHLRTPFA